MFEDTSKLDVIGDVHGDAAGLRALLGRLGYAEFSGTWRHPERRALFVGDLVDRGADVGGVLEIVQRMERRGSALVVMGNHEYNLLRWYTADHVGRPQMDHTDEKRHQLRDTLRVLEADDALARRVLDWLRGLPLWVETGGLRCCHAYWGDAGTAPLGGRRTLDEFAWTRRRFRKTPEGRALDLLLKAPETKLPDGAWFLDPHGKERNDTRIAWWRPLGPQSTWSELAAATIHDLPDGPVPPKALAGWAPYPADAPPLFVGHYKFERFPGRLAPNVACVDFGAGIGAYRYDGEQVLDDAKFVTEEER